MQPVQQTPQEDKGRQQGRRLSHIIAHWVHRLRFVLWAVLIAAAVLVVGYLVWSEVGKKRLVDSTLLAEAAQGVFDSWESEQDEAKKAALEKDLGDQLEKLVSRYPRQYGAQRGLFLRADLAFRKKEWAAARADYEELARRFPRSYLAAVSLFNAGVCAEENGDADGAQGLYMRVADTWKDSGIVPRALFNAGRLDEQKGAWEEAQKKYERLESDYAASSWTKLAKNRIISLKVEGKLK